MSMETDQNMALVRRLHLELNGSGRRARGTVQSPTKKLKRELITSASAGEAPASKTDGHDFSQL